MTRRLPFLLVLCAALMWVASCGTARPQTGNVAWVASTGEAIEDSGRRLSGDYLVRAITDDYTQRAVQAPPRWSFSFKDDGSFQSEREAGGVMRVEAGSYLISAQGALVLFVETVGGNALSDARNELYQIESQTDSELHLRSNGSMAIVLRKK
ncbi:MAG: hypothetical protein ACJ74J_05315 [Blastocatellia bacterium]